MKFSSKSRYALRVMVDLAEHEGEIQSIKAISERQTISEKYLEQIAALLSKAGLIESFRGAQGGYTLKKPKAQISVGEIMRAAEGDFYVIDCLDPNMPCNIVDKCKTHSYWNKLNTLVTDYLNTVSLEDILKEQ
ncbi:MAG: RrF2 family transcriptional regulator [Clostridia bacterium]|nr:RrF2 family transcriptional regulator [Clostridia bacterium]